MVQVWVLSFMRFFKVTDVYYDVWSYVITICVHSTIYITIYKVRIGHFIFYNIYCLYVVGGRARPTISYFDQIKRNVGATSYKEVKDKKDRMAFNTSKSLALKCKRERESEYTCSLKYDVYFIYIIL